MAKTFNDTWDDQITVAQLFSNIAITTTDCEDKILLTVTPTTARAIAAELIRLANIAEEGE